MNDADRADREIVERLQKMPIGLPFIDNQTLIQDIVALIESQAAEIERLRREVIQTMKTGKPGAAYDLTTAPGFRHKPGEA